MIIIVYFTADIIFERIFICGYCVFRSTIVFMYTYIAYRYTIVLTFINNNWYFRYYITFFELKFMVFIHYIILYWLSKAIWRKIKTWILCSCIYMCAVLHHTKLVWYTCTCYIVRCASRFFPSHIHTRTHTYIHHIFFSLPERLFQTLFYADGWKYYKKHFIFAGRADGIYVYIHMCVCWPIM